MHFLLTNDDGISSPALQQLKSQLSAFGRVTVIAPDRNQSATSQALTLHRPLRIHTHGEDTYSVDGTPTDCVLIAFHGLLVDRPDFVVSGINHGPNMGEDVLYSGTVAAAMEGLALGVPAIAVSFAGRVLRGDDSTMLEHVEPLAKLLQHLTSLPAFPADTLFNVNLPPIPAADVKGVKLTRLGRRVFSDSIAKMKDPWGRPIFWIGGGSVTWSSGEGTDVAAVNEGFISVTPLHLDVTHQARLDDAALWWKAP